MLKIVLEPNSPRRGAVNFPVRSLHQIAHALPLRAAKVIEVFKLPDAVFTKDIGRVCSGAAVEIAVGEPYQRLWLFTPFAGKLAMVSNGPAGVIRKISPRFFLLSTHLVRARFWHFGQCRIQLKAQLQRGSYNTTERLINSID
jgi:hypothetical protein